MQLILLKSPGAADERTFYLKPGLNTFGSDSANDISVATPGILPHHLNIEYKNDALHINAAKSSAAFISAGRVCYRATIKPGEGFAIGEVHFYCHAVAAPERTQQAIDSSPIISPALGSRPAALAALTPTLQDLQISGFVTQRQITSSFVIGRNPSCSLILEHPQVSGFHARVTREGTITYIEDMQSSNGTYVSDVRIFRKTPLQPGDSIVIMPYFLIFTGEFLNVYTFQRESKLIGWQVSVHAAARKILDRVTIACSSNELVGLIGPSGSGKTTLMRCLSGQIIPAGGRVQLNGIEIYSHFDLFKSNIGFVPQDDIIHRELSVTQTLMYSAKLRLPPDMSDRERKIRVWETLIELELEEQERSAIHQLSGGQRKRVNIAIELLTKPGILFLDEPTSGLDPSLDEKLMVLFKKLSQDGRITVMTTHLLEHAAMFSKIALMHYGRLIFFGTPAQALQFFDVPAINALYTRIKERPADELQEEFQKTDLHQSSLISLRDQVLPSKRKEVIAPFRGREPLSHEVAQLGVLSRRYLHIILRDRKNTGILLLQAPLIALFINIATSNLSSRLFMMALAAIWFGCNNSAREICKELPLYRRERMVNLSIVPYLGSKFFVLCGLVFLQCTVLALLTYRDFLQAYIPLLLCGLAGISLGLLISAIVDSPDKAIALVPIILIPQVLFSGIFGELKGFQRSIGEFMISKWSYNLLKKEFDLPTFRLKDRLESQIDANQQTMKNAQQEMDKLQQELDEVLDDMGDASSSVDISMLQYDADRLMKEMKDQQKVLERARKGMQQAERNLRENARLFVWVDRPESRSIDWVVLTMLTIVFMVGSAAWLRHRDHLLKQL